MKLPPSCSVYALILSAGLFGQSAMGAIVAPVSATTTGGNLSNRPIEEAINGNGLSSGGTSGNILTETHNVNSTNGGEYYISSLGNPSPTLTFDLGGTYSIDTLHLWNYTRGGQTDRTIRTFDLTFSSDGVNFGSTISFSEYSQLSTSTPISVESRSFAVQAGVTHIRMENIVNWGDPDYVGLSEIRFGAIPEPRALMLASLSGLMLLRRRR